MGGSFPDVGRHVHDSFFNGQHHDGGDDWHPDAGQNSQRTCSNQLVGVLQGEQILLFETKVIPEPFLHLLCVFLLRQVASSQSYKYKIQIIYQGLQEGSTNWSNFCHHV